MKFQRNKNSGAPFISNAPLEKLLSGYHQHIKQHGGKPSQGGMEPLEQGEVPFDWRADWERQKDQNRC